MEAQSKFSPQAPLDSLKSDYTCNKYQNLVFLAQNQPFIQTDMHDFYKHHYRHNYIIRIHHECEGGIEKSIPRIINWYYKACRVMTKGDRKGQIFLSHPHANNGFLFLLTTNYPILYLKKHEKDFQKILNMLRWFSHTLQF